MGSVRRHEMSDGSTDGRTTADRRSAAPPYTAERHPSFGKNSQTWNSNIQNQNLDRIEGH